jgi:hypothetical protein
MGLFSRSNKTAFPLIEGSHEVVVIGDDQFPVVRTLPGGPAQKVTLERELGNRLDPYAILVRVNGSPAGYLSSAEDYAPMVTGQHSVNAVVKELYPAGRALFVLLPLIAHHHEALVQALSHESRVEEQLLENELFAGREDDDDYLLVEQSMDDFAPASDGRHLSVEADATRAAG